MNESPISKYHLAPEPFHSEEFLTIEKEADVIHEKFDEAREMTKKLGSTHQDYPDATYKMRTLRQELASIDAKSRKQFADDNPEWMNFWFDT